MNRAEKMDCRANGEVILTGATTEFQLKKGLTHPRYMRWERLPFGIPVAEFLRDVLKINVYKFPGFQLYDRSNFFLALLFGFLITIAAAYENIRVNYITERKVYFLSYLEITFLIYVIPLFLSYQLLVNANMSLNILILVNLLPGFIILFLSVIKILADQVRRRTLVFLVLFFFLFLFILNQLIFTLSKSMSMVLFTGNALTLFILLYLRYLRSNAEKRHEVLTTIFGYRHSYHNK